MSTSKTKASRKPSSQSASRWNRLRLEVLEDRLAPADLGFALGVGGPTIAEDIGRAVATDSAGNVYVAGSFRHTVDFAPGVPGGELTSVSGALPDGFVAKYSAAGTLLWAKRFGDHNIDLGTGIAVDALGNVVVAGSFVGTIDFGNGAALTNTNTHNFENGFVAKLDSAGNGVWARQVQSPSSDSVNAIALDAAGNVYTTGYFSGTATFGNGGAAAELTPQFGADVFVWKLDGNGNHIWNDGFDGSGAQDFGHAIAVDAIGNVYATGQFQGTLSFISGATDDLGSAGGTLDVFVAKLNPNGSFAWARGFGSALDTDVGQGIAADSSGNVYTTGYFRYAVDFDPGPGVDELSDTFQEVFVSKLDTNGNHVWARQMGLLGGHDRGYALALDGQANVYTTGFYGNLADFDPGPGTRVLSPAGAFVSKLNSAGNFVEAIQISGMFPGGAAEGRGIAVGPGGNVAISGWFSGTVGFPDLAGSTTLTSSFLANRDIYVARLDFNGGPTDIVLSPSSVAENTAIGTVVGTLSTTDPDLPGDSHSYMLLDNAGGRFSLDGNQIKVAGAIDFEATPTLQIQVKSTDAGSLSVTKVLTISVTNVPENGAPTDISLSPASVAENTAVGTVVGTLSTTDPDLPGDSHTYELLNNAGGRFSLDGNQIKVAGAIDFEATPTLQIQVKSTDAGSLSVTKTLTISVTNVLEAAGFDVQHGQTQRSYVRYLDLAFADAATDVNALLGSGRVKLTRFNLDGSGAGVDVALAGVMSASAGQLSLDFGAQGIGGNRNSIVGDGYYDLSLDLDGNGTYETTRKFYRLLGDVNGDRSVTITDALLVLTAYNTSNPERDVNGDGIVNITDIVFALRSLGRRLGTGLVIDD